MIKKQFSFLHMDSSDAMISHANEKLERVNKMLSDEPEPKTLVIRFKHISHGAQNEAEFNLSTKRYKTVISSQESDIYRAIDNAVDKLYRWIAEEKHRMKDMNHEGPDYRAEKKNFQKP